MLVAVDGEVAVVEVDHRDRYRAVIDRSYPLEDMVAATTYVETGQKTGTVVLTLNGEHVESRQLS